MNKALNQDLLAWSAPRQQAVFRQLMNAFSYPGRVEALVEGEALKQMLATLLDSEATLADPQNLVDSLTRQRLQTRLTGPERAQFIVADGSQVPAFEPCLGTLESPEQGATIVLKVSALGAGEGEDEGWQLTGPGISSSQALAVTGLHPEWLARRQLWNEGFPLGIDVILCDAERIVALPRTTSIISASTMAVTGEKSWAT